MRTFRRDGFHDFSEFDGYSMLENHKSAIAKEANARGQF